MTRTLPLLLPSCLTALLALGCAGNVNDALVEARRGDPESVKEAVVLLGQLLAEKESAEYPYDRADLEAIDYLKEVMVKAPEAVNRAIATSSLGRLRRPEATADFLARLDDSSWLVQLEAVKALARRPTPELSAPLAKKLGEEIRMEVRLEVVKTLAITGGEAALAALLDAFLDRTVRYRNMRLVTYEGLLRLSGRRLDFEDVEGWRAYRSERFPQASPPPGTEAQSGSS